MIDKVFFICFSPFGVDFLILFNYREKQQKSKGVTVNFGKNGKS
jgi:hypothetical protein